MEIIVLTFRQRCHPEFLDVANQLTEDDDYLLTR